MILRRLQGKLRIDIYTISKEFFCFCRSTSDCHIVVDNSNLFIGAQSGQGANGQQDYNIRINVPKLVNVIETDKKIRSIKTRIVGGSIPPRNARVWTEWERCHYQCLLGERGFSNKVRYDTCLSFIKLNRERNFIELTDVL